jgi:hypothetical protein
MDPRSVLVIAILMFAIYVGWGYMSGRRGRVPLYVVALIVGISMFGAALAQLVQQSGAAEAFNVACIALSLAALASPPALWEVQLREDWERARLYQSLKGSDLVSWRAWLKLVDRLGARGAALAYFGVFCVGVGLELLVLGITQPSTAFFLMLALTAPVLFGAVSATWIYRGVRRVMPGA